MFILMLIILVVFLAFNINKMNEAKKINISEWSYKRFARFYDEVICSDSKFNDKINKILKLVNEDNVTSIKVIAKKSGCTIKECILKLKYCIYKKLLVNKYIDIKSKEIKDIMDEDLELVEKYKIYLYDNHYSLGEIALKSPIANLDNIEEIEESVYTDIKYLLDKNLIYGVKLEDRVLIYYSIEKRKFEDSIHSIECSNCGVLVDVNINSKAKCKNCGRMVKDNYDKK